MSKSCCRCNNRCGCNNNCCSCRRNFNNSGCNNCGGFGGFGSGGWFWPVLLLLFFGWGGFGWGGFGGPWFF